LLDYSSDEKEEVKKVKPEQLVTTISNPKRAFKELVMPYSSLQRNGLKSTAEFKIVGLSELI